MALGNPKLHLKSKSTTKTWTPTDPWTPTYLKLNQCWDFITSIHGKCAYLFCSLNSLGSVVTVSSVASPPILQEIQRISMEFAKWQLACDWCIPCVCYYSMLILPPRDTLVLCLQLKQVLRLSTGACLRREHTDRHASLSSADITAKYTADNSKQLSDQSDTIRKVSTWRELSLAVQTKDYRADCRAQGSMISSAAKTI